MGNDEVSWEKVFGAQVRSLRTAAEWTQSDLAERMSAAGFSMHQTTVAKMESGSRPTTISEAAALATIFTVTLDEMLGPVRQVQAAQRRVELESELARIEGQLVTHECAISELRGRRDEVSHELREVMTQATASPTLAVSKVKHPTRARSLGRGQHPEAH